MILIINGSFGVGKTTVGRLLSQRIPMSRLYNPEWVGSILMRVPLPIKLCGSGTDDFQDIDLWRRSVIYGTKLFRHSPRNTVILPMAFSRKDYFDEIISGIREFDNEIKIYCLKAGITTIRKRLESRGENLNTQKGLWIVSRAEECIVAHQDTYFGEPIDTEAVSAVEVTNQIVSRLDQTTNY
jgi:hypothetical protein